MFILLAAFVADLMLSQIEGSVSTLLAGHWLAITSGVGLVILAFVRVNYFHYDDSYEILHIRSQSLFSFTTDPNTNTRYDFPKRKVVDYEIKKNLFYTTLVLHLENYASASKKIRSVDMTFMSSTDRKKVTSSLQNIVDRNRTEPQTDPAL
jgi:hypothetical protein